MRLLISMLLVVCCTSCQHGREMRMVQPARAVNESGRSDIRWLFASQFGSAKYEFAVSDTVLHSASKWRAEKDPLPLTPSRAERAAMEEARRLAPDVSSWGSAIDIVLRRVDDDCWYYEVLFLRADVAITGLPPENFYLKIPVLMNGVAVHPILPR